MVMSDRVLQIVPELEPQKILLADVATQGWAVATATEANLPRLALKHRLFSGR